MKKQHWNLGSTKVLVLAGLLAGACMAFAGQAKVEAAACPAVTADLGADTLTVNIPAAATYTIWTRMKAPDVTHNTVNLQVDTTDCFAVGGGSFTATAWNANSSNWINYSGGTVANRISLNLSAGNHTLKYIGTQASVEIDKIIVSSDAACTPVGVGTNCQSGDSTAPTVSVQSPTAGQSVTGTLNMAATAADASGIAQVSFLVDGQAVGNDTTSPYTLPWASTTATNGSHAVTARATDTAGNSATSAPVTITVTNSGTPSPGKKGDLNGDGKVSITDLSILLSHWNQTGVPANQGDVNADGKVNLTDLSILLSNWG